MNFNAILRETSNRRVSVEQKRTLEGPTISGCQSEALAINLLLEEALAKSGGNLIEPNLITLVRDFNSNDISGVLREKIRRLQERLDAGCEVKWVSEWVSEVKWVKWSEVKWVKWIQKGSSNRMKVIYVVA